jgi:AcrR family transcriptional regulator
MEKLTKTQRDEKRRKEIVLAAKRCVVENGFHETSVSTIAKEAKINVGQLYRYFDTKEEIIKAISEDIFNKALEKIKNNGGILGLFVGDQTDMMIMGEIYSEANRNREINRIMRSAEKKISTMIKKEIKKVDATLSESDTETAERMLFVLCGGLFLLKMRNGTQSKKEIEELSEKMFRLLLPNLSKVNINPII